VRGNAEYFRHPKDLIHKNRRLFLELLIPAFCRVYLPKNRERKAGVSTDESQYEAPFLFSQKHSYGIIFICRKLLTTNEKLLFQQTPS
jgi:hypothetical protein